MKKLWSDEVILSFGAHRPDPPPAASSTERGFSHMKFVKSYWGHKLIDAHTSDLMTILLASLMNHLHWNNAGPISRRTNFITDSGDIEEDSGESDIGEVTIAQIPKDLVFKRR